MGMVQVNWLMFEGLMGVCWFEILSVMKPHCEYIEDGMMDVGV